MLGVILYVDNNSMNDLKAIRKKKEHVNFTQKTFSRKKLRVKEEKLTNVETTTQEVFDYTHFKG